MREDLDRYFRAEAREILEGLARGLLDLERDPGRGDVLAQCFRLAHTLKGAARAVQRVHIGELAHAIEDALAPFRDSAEVPAADLVTDLLKLLALIRSELGSGDVAAILAQGRPIRRLLLPIRVGATGAGAPLGFSRPHGSQKGDP